MKANQQQKQAIETLKAAMPDNALLEALDLTTGDRHHSYGPPTKNFQVTAALMGEYLEAKQEPFPLSTIDVAVLMILLKVARLAESPMKRDHFVDIAGYASCGTQCQDHEGAFQRTIETLAAGLPEMPFEPQEIVESSEDDDPPQVIKDIAAALEACTGGPVEVTRTTPDAIREFIDESPTPVQFTQIDMGSASACYRSISSVKSLPGVTALFEDDKPISDSGVPVAIWDSSLKAKIELPPGVRNGLHLILEGPEDISLIAHSPHVSGIGHEITPSGSRVATFFVQNHE